VFVVFYTGGGFRREKCTLASRNYDARVSQLSRRPAARLGGGTFSRADRLSIQCVSGSITLRCRQSLYHATIAHLRDHRQGHRDFRQSVRLPAPLTGAVQGRQNTSSEQPPPNLAAANFVVITNREGCALNGTAVAAVLIGQ